MPKARNIRRVLGVAVLTGAVAWLGFGAIGENQARAVVAAASDRTLPAPLARLAEAGPWVNAPLSPDLRGKVVLVNFWTYSCINSLRPLPYLLGWADKYRDDGLVVIGVHAPEFSFERDLSKVRRATSALGVNYPVLLDRDLAVWRAFGNQGWPGLVFIDATGHIRDYRLGEGHYAESERLIQRLLAEAKGASVSSKAIAAIDGKGEQAAPDWANLGSPETYIGYRQTRNFASPERIGKDMPRQYRVPAMMPLNHWSLGGTWSIGPESAALRSPSGTIGYRFHARDLHLVLGAARWTCSAHSRDHRRVRSGADHGADINEQGWGTVREDRLYQLIRQSRSVTDRNFEITFFAPGVRAYAFTFG